MTKEPLSELEQKLIGIPFLDIVRDASKRCEQETDGQLMNLGKKTPECYTNVGTVLSLIDRMASCFWACRGGDHHVEYLIGRASSTTSASLSLARQGFYDECLSLTRSVGEIANLLVLFASDPDAHQEWHAADAQRRKRDFSPVKIRLALEEKIGFVPIDQDRYKILCEIATHVTPQTTPQVFNPNNVPSCRNAYQEMGVMLSINEIALPLGFVALAGGRLLELEAAVFENVTDQSSKLLDSIGSVGITEYSKVWQLVNSKPAT